AYAANDVFKIAVEANVVKYYQNNVLRYISATAPTLPLLVDVSINTTGGTITNAIVSNYNTGTFTATATNAGTPAFQWYVNGAPISGETSATYINTSLGNNNVVTCTMTPGLGGCTLVPPYTSNSITNKAVPAPTSIDFYLSGTISTTACTEAIEQVVWKISDLVNTQATGNNLLKINATGWNGGAASWNTVANNGYLEFTASETNTERMIGLSATNINSSYTTIQYAIYLVNNGTVRVFESNIDRGGFGSYATNDVFRVSVEANVVKYFRNDVLFYTSTVAPTLPLLVDVSINQTGGTITNARVVNNSNAGTFTVTAINAGVNPNFNWQVNGFSVQTGTSTTYTNTSLVSGDIVTAILTPDLGGCSLTNYTSNSITINGPGALPTTWTGATDTNWYNAGNWDNGIPNKFKSAIINSGTPNNVSLTASANVYDITIQPGATFTISGTNQLYVFRNFTNNGIFVANSSRVNFTGCSNSSVLSSSGAQTFFNLTVNTSFGLTISSGTHQVSNNFTFTNGIVTQNATLLFLAGSSATGANALSYVNGTVQKAGTTAFVFPTGSATRFARIGIGAPSASTTFTARYFSTPFGTYTNAAAPLPIFNNVSAREYWTLNQTVGSGNAAVTLYWEDSQFSQINDCSTTDLRVARYNGSAWQNNNNAVTTTGTCSLSSAFAGTVSTSAVVTQFGSFTFGSLSSSVNPLPIVLKNFTVSLSGLQSVYLNWLTSSELNNNYFELQRSTDGESFVSIGTVKGAGTTVNETRYQFNDKSALRGINYYRLKQVDFDGKYSYSSVVSIEIDFDVHVFLPTIFPNPTDSENIHVGIETSDKQGPIRLRILDQLGKVVFMSTIENVDDEPMDIKLESKLAAGLYIAYFEQGFKKETIRLVIKE
ncbi:MAG: T9SS type A sorting domain-containing protein, partial [Cyclobacteriaceae bacterium]